MATQNSINNYFGSANVNIATDANAKTTTIGNTTGASALNLNTGTGDCTLASATGTLMLAHHAGYMNYPLLPAFYYYLSANDTNATGNGATYTLGGGNVLTQLFDQGGNCSTTGIFTAPVTGLYYFIATIKFTAMSAAMTSGVLSIVATAATSTVTINTGTAQTGGNAFSFNSGFFVSMTAADTCTVNVVLSNGIGNTATATAGTKGSSFFCGYQVA